MNETTINGNKDNRKVPMAILSCFLIAFILQGILKLSGIFIFEKALNWEMFRIIDENITLQIIYYSLLVSVTVYCLSFALTTKSYSKKWYHYFLIFIVTFVIITIRVTKTISYELDIMFDICLYILIPFIVNLTTDKENKLFGNKLNDIILTFTIQIGLYFCYLGLGYWSSLLTSIIPLDPIWLYSSLSFLTQFEMYIGIVTFTLSMNVLVIKIKEDMKMRRPIDIASDEAKIKELEDLAKKGK